MKNGFIKKADIVLAVILLVIGFGSMALLSKGVSENAKVEITIDGKVYKSADLKKNQVIDINNEFGHNIVVIEDEKVFVKEADCSGQDCVNTKAISKEGQIILCLPHHLIITITEGGSIDGIAY